MDWPNVYALGRQLEALFHGSPLEKAYAMGGREYFFVFRRHKRGMRVVLDPKEPHVLVQEKPGPMPEEPTPFVMVIRKHLERGKLKSIKVPPGERLLWLEFDPGALVLELMPRTPNLIAIWDGFLMGSHAPVERPKGHIIAHGAPYVKPMRTKPPLDIWRVTEPEFSRALVAAGEAEPGAALRGAFPYLPDWFAAEFAFLAGEGAAAWAVFEQMRAALREPAPDGARLYAPPGAQRAEKKTDVLLSPVPLRHQPPERERIFGDYFEAVAAWAGMLGRGGFLDTPASSALRRLRHDLQRTEGSLEKVRREREAALGAETLRRKGELILIALSKPNLRNGVLHCMDIYEDPPVPVSIVMDAKKTLPENAEAFFRRARRLQEALPRIEARLRELEGGAQRLRGLISSVEAEPERAAEIAPAEGAPRPRREKAPPSKTPKGMRMYRSSDGYVIYAGKDARGNERLTLKVARPHDLWLHAHNYGGSHVIVMNPSKGKDVPERTLREAAEIAAYWSQGRPNRHMDVAWCLRSQVRKPKGAPTGQVVLRSFNVIRVEPKEGIEEVKS